MSRTRTIKHLIADYGQAVAVCARSNGDDPRLYEKQLRVERTEAALLTALKRAGLPISDTVTV